MSSDPQHAKASTSDTTARTSSSSSSSSAAAAAAAASVDSHTEMQTATAASSSSTSSASIIATLEQKLETMRAGDDELLKPYVQLSQWDTAYGSFIRDLPYELILYICEFVEIVFNEELRKRLCERQYRYDRESMGDKAKKSTTVQTGPVLMKFFFGYFKHDPNRNCFLIFRHIHDHFCEFYKIGLRSLETLSLDVATTIDINDVLSKYPGLRNFILTYCTRSSESTMLALEKTEHRFRKVIMPYFGSLEMQNTPKLANIFSQYPTLEYLVLYNHSIGAEGARMLSTLPKLRTLDVSKNGITDEGAIHLFRMPSLKSLSVAHNRLTRDAFAALVPGSGNTTNLTDLNLTRVPLDTESMRFLIQCPSLKKLTFGGVKSEFERDGYTTDVEVQPNLLEMLIGTNHIENLNLRYNRAIGTDTGMKWLVDNTALRRANLTLCNLQSLPEALSCHPKLEVLDLRKNSLDDSAALVLSKIPRLRNLILDDNDITDTAGEYLASSKSLISLSVNGHERLTDVGVRHLLHSETIEELSLRAVGMTDEGLRDIGQNNTIRFLYCANTDIGDETITEKSLEYMRQNSSLTDFRLFGRSFIKFKQEFDNTRYDEWLEQQDDEETMQVEVGNAMQDDDDGGDN